ncbi:MAG: secretion protein HlyD, partial [Methylotenera sp.]
MQEFQNNQDALQLAKTPDFVRRYVRLLAYLFFVLPALALFLPWQQNVTALGKVTAFSPNDRLQTVDAPITGLISKWHVQEGT